MASSYDKLGDLLNEVLKNGSIPAYKKQKDTNSQNKKTYKNQENIKNNTENSKSKQRKNVKKNKKVDSLSYKNTHLYKFFNLSSTATVDDLKKSYHKLLKKYHPDSIPPLPNMQALAAKKTQEIIKNYEELKKILTEETETKTE